MANDGVVQRKRAIDRQFELILMAALLLEASFLVSLMLWL